ncbi:hypothetical protein DFJ58DRAFT_837783 [Suillus subalutaceus]|uniref:uncharacterized protein n=1 Tax=Suillus subalutaceus TaxID=48586 RepID=UPI001B87549B|nr:uncharacterized protein DFJ58DRAFT_837783 [Suillus subalutaceus]KAG1868945.1 hypothetical protein DFJ58DRAFT_837783 [Suillus subalutaceus]
MYYHIVFLAAVVFMKLAWQVLGTYRPAELHDTHAPPEVHRHSILNDHQIERRSQQRWGNLKLMVVTCRAVLLTSINGEDDIPNPSSERYISHVIKHGETPGQLSSCVHTGAFYQ